MGSGDMGVLAVDDLEAAEDRRRLRAAWWTLVDRSVLETAALIAVAEAALLGLAFIAPPEMKAFDLDAFAAADRFVSVMLRPAVESKRPARKGPRRPEARASARPGGEEGLSGPKDRPMIRRRAGSEQTTAEQLAAARQARDRRLVQGRGLLRVLSQVGGGAGLDDILGTGGLNKDIDREMGGFTGRTAVAGAGPGGGYGGLGDRGLGLGGGGPGDLASLGSLSTGRGPDGFDLLGSRRLRRPGEQDVTVETGPPLLLDALPRSVIRAAIHRRRAQVRACYERELINTPGLSGKILVRFTIGPQGLVSDAGVAQSTLSNRNVEQCLLRKVRTWRFPKPRGGGRVVVRYPFLFAPAGG